jgi:hypothetical protein
MPAVLAGLPDPIQGLLQRRFSPPCGDTDRLTYSGLASELGLHPAALIAPTSPEACARAGGIEVTPSEILLGTSTDDPDQGMDQNLPPELDPSDYRRTMGGATGPSSQAFRHMYFGGWSPLRPMATLQVPPWRQGEAPDRAQLLALKARALLRSGQVIWGFRVLGWAMHYVQDLAQPFHSAQVPSLRMIPWYVAIHWPPKEAYADLVRESARSVSNYHRGYEGYVLHRILEGQTSPFVDCLKNPGKYATLAIERGWGPRELALGVASAAIDLAPRTGPPAVELLGLQLRGPDFHLAVGKGKLDYADLAIRPDLMNARFAIDETTCKSLANTVLASQYLIAWALKN